MDTTFVTFPKQDGIPMLPTSLREQREIRMDVGRDHDTYKKV